MFRHYQKLQSTSQIHQINQHQQEIILHVEYKPILPFKSVKQEAHEEQKVHQASRFYLKNHGFDQQIEKEAKIFQTEQSRIFLNPSATSKHFYQQKFQKQDDFPMIKNYELFHKDLIQKKQVHQKIKLHSTSKSRDKHLQRQVSKMRQKTIPVRIINFTTIKQERQKRQKRELVNSKRTKINLASNPNKKTNNNYVNIIKLYERKSGNEIQKFQTPERSKSKRKKGILVLSSRSRKKQINFSINNSNKLNQSTTLKEGKSIQIHSNSFRANLIQNQRYSKGISIHHKKDLQKSYAVLKQFKT